MVKFILEGGAAIEISEKDEELMEIVGDIRTLEGKDVKQISMATINPHYFEMVLQILKLVNYSFLEVAKIKGSEAHEYIGKELAEFLHKKTFKEINELYLTAHQLKIAGLKNNVAAFMACKVYTPVNIEDLNKKKQELGIKNEFTSDMSVEFKKKYPFLS